MKIEKNTNSQTVLAGNNVKKLKGKDETSKDRVILGERENDNFLTMGEQLKDMKSSSFASKFDVNDFSGIGTVVGGLLGAGAGEALAITFFGTNGLILGGLGGAIVGGTIGLVTTNILLDRSVQNSFYDEY